MVLDFDAWMRGDIEKFVGLISSIEEVNQNIEAFHSESRPGRKNLLLKQIQNKFHDVIPKKAWLKLITQDNNIEIFSRYFPHIRSTNIETSDLVYISNFPACSWAFCYQLKNNPTMNTSIIVFMSAVKYCMNIQNKKDVIGLSELIYQRIRAIWNVNILYKFKALPLIYKTLRMKYLEQLYTVDNIKMALQMDNILGFEYLPLINLIINNLQNLPWNAIHQYKLLAEMADKDYSHPINVLDHSMCLFNHNIQRKIWQTLSHSELTYYKELNWYVIDDKILPCHDQICSVFLNILVTKNQIYDYKNKVSEYVCKCHPNEMIRLIDAGLLGLNNKILWSNNSSKHIRVLINYWLEHIPSNLEVAELISTNINNINYYAIKHYLILQVEKLLPFYPGSHCLYEELFKIPIPSDYTPSTAVRQHLYAHIPHLIDLDTYELNKGEIIKLLTESKIKLTNGKVIQKLLSDMVNDQLFSYFKVLNNIPSYKWQTLKIPDDIVDSLLSRIKQTKTIDDIDPTVLSELSRQSNTLDKLPSKKTYIQYMGVHYSIEDLQPELINYILYLKPFPLFVYNKSTSYSNVLTIYEHYQTFSQEHMLTINQIVLVDMLNKYPKSPLVHKMFLSCRNKRYSLDDSTLMAMPDSYIRDHCVHGMIIIKPTQFRYLSSDIINILRSRCAYCRLTVRIDQNHVRLICGHVAHKECLSNEYPCCINK